MVVDGEGNPCEEVTEHYWFDEEHVGSSRLNRWFTYWASDVPHGVGDRVYARHSMNRPSVELAGVIVAIDNTEGIWPSVIVRIDP